MSVETLVSAQEVAKHNTSSNCWVIIHNYVYDLTDFLSDHPGGANVITKHAGQDATKAFDPIHPIDIIQKYLPPHVCKGRIDVSTVKEVERVLSEEEKQRQREIDAKPGLSEMLNLMDFEAVAKRIMTPGAWAYYSSGADDEFSLRENRNAFLRIWLSPRVMRNVTHVDITTKILGFPSTLPLYISATALGKLGHPEGELVLTRAAHKAGIIQMIPTLASCSLDELTAAAMPGQVQFFQLYVNRNRSITEKIVKQAEHCGCRALFITVDAPQLGRREKDMRMKFQEHPPDVQKEGDIDRSAGAAKAISNFIDPGLCWSDLSWFRQITNLPIILKGIQCSADAVLAAKHGCAGVVISNHGGRQLDTAQSGIEILPEVIRALRSANLHHGFEVYVDGGIRRGTDIFKAIAMGATAVGIGRPFLYAMSAYGEKGVERAIELLKDELEMCMRLMGVQDFSKIENEMIKTNGLYTHVAPVPQDTLHDTIYEKMIPPKSRL